MLGRKERNPLTNNNKYSRTNCEAAHNYENKKMAMLYPAENEQNVPIILHAKLFYLSHLFIRCRHVVQWMALFISFNNPPRKINLLTHHEYKCLPNSSSTSGSPSNPAYVFTRVPREVKEYYMVYALKVNPSGCSVTIKINIKLRDNELQKSHAIL